MSAGLAQLRDYVTAETGAQAQGATTVRGAGAHHHTRGPACKLRPKRGLGTGGADVLWVCVPSCEAPDRADLARGAREDSERLARHGCS
jgi:hypothetical protein